LRVGTITSPNLQRVNERMTIDGVPVDDATLDDLLYAAMLVEQEVGVEASYFEILVAIALRWFADEAVEVAVVEVGMGGTWDATRPTSTSSRSSPPAMPSASCAAMSISGCVATTSPSADGTSISTRPGPSTPTSSCPSTARTRATTPPSRWQPRKPSSTRSSH